ncbi:MAG: hypothetical protein EHM79_18665 [Geobacter sp.]|nr:MAG: hypothetical protein EHM79_18665 [Geobacter sp.]
MKRDFKTGEKVRVLGFGEEDEFFEEGSGGGDMIGKIGTVSNEEHFYINSDNASYRGALDFSPPIKYVDNPVFFYQVYVGQPYNKKAYIFLKKEVKK